MGISRRDLLVSSAGFRAELPLIGAMSPALADCDGGDETAAWTGDSKWTHYATMTHKHTHARPAAPAALSDNSIMRIGL
jgi:hypothetical protein